MSYQNNNNRIVPQATGLTNITPVASPVSARIRYQPHIRAGATNLAQSLSTLGRGVYDLDLYFQNNAKANAIDQIILDDVEGNNQHDWKVASDRIEGLAKFNPYLKDSYKGLATNDISKKLLYEVAALQNSEKMTPDAYKQLLTTQQAKLMDYCRENKISTRQAGQAMLAFQEQVKALEGKQFVANAQYTYDVSLAKANEEALTQSRNIIYNTTVKDRATTLTSFFNNYADTLSSQGVPPEDIYKKCLIPTAQTLINQLATDDDIDFNVNDVIQGIKETNKLNNINANTLNPNWEYDLRQYYDTAKRQAFLKTQQDYQQQQYQKQINIDKGTNDFLKWYVENPTANLTDVQDKILELSQDNPELLTKLTSTMYTYNNQVRSLKSIASNEDVINALIVDTVSGQLSSDKILAAIPELSKTDALKFYTLLKSQEDDLYRKEVKEQQAIAKAQEKAIKTEAAKETAAKKALKEYGTRFGKDLQGKIPNGLLNQAIVNTMKVTGNKDYRNQISTAYQQICQDVVDGTITNQEGLKKLQDLEKDTLKVANMMSNTSSNNSGKVWKPTDLLVRDARAKMKIPLIHEYNEATSLKALSQMGIFKAINNQPIISSNIQKHRDYDNRPHQSIDVPLKVGTPLYVPKGVQYAKVIVSGEMEGKGKDSLGKYCLIQLGKNGEGGYIRLAHLSKLIPSGTELGQGGIMAYSGNTGFSSSPHVDIEFWNNDLSNPRRLLAGDFLKQIQGMDKHK